VTGGNAEPIGMVGSTCAAIMAPAVVAPSIVAPSIPQQVLLMAIKVRVFSEILPRKRVDALAFFDPGAQVTLVKKSLVVNLNLPKLLDGDLEVSPFHARKPLKLKAPQHSICIELENGDHETLAAHRTDFIVPSVRRADWESGVLVPVDEEPDILIGMADFWRFFKSSEPLSSHLFRIHTSVSTMVCGRNGVPNRYGLLATALPIVVSAHYNSEDFVPNPVNFNDETAMTDNDIHFVPREWMPSYDVFQTLDAVI
jgi:hypothetical protein